MAYTVKQLADLAGVSVRTLHYYDEIGLLVPPNIGANGYRLYDHASVLRLQVILFYRELDFPLEAIKAALDRPDHDPLAALRQQRTALAARLGRLHRLISTLDDTIRHLENQTPMDAKKMFDHLSPAQEDAYTAEAARRWDPAMVQASHQRWKRYSASRRAEILEEGNAVYRDLVAALPLDPGSAPVQAGIERWRAHLAHFWTPDDAQCLGLARGYVEDPAFRATFDRFDPRLAEFMLRAVEIHVARRSSG